MNVDNLWQFTASDGSGAMQKRILNLRATWKNEGVRKREFFSFFSLKRGEKKSNSESKRAALIINSGEMRWIDEAIVKP